MTNCESTDYDNQHPPHGWILYDGSCGACSHFVGGRATFYGRYGFGVVAAQEPWVQEKLSQFPVSEVREIRLLRPDGQLIRGPDVYREVTSKVPWLIPVNVFSRLPVLRNIFDLGYKLFAANRHRISKVCKLDSKARFRPQ